MNQKWTRAICTVLTSALVFTGPAVEGTTFSGYINSGLEKVYAKTQKQKDAEKKKSQAEQDLKDKKNEINGLKDQQQTTADDIKNKSAKLDEILAGKKSVGLAGHVRPDGDCVGSTLGVYNYIRKYYPDVDVRLYLEPIPNIFKFLNFSSEIRSDYEESVVFDLFIAMDCGDEKRLGNAARYFQEAKHTACIDHHVSNQSFAEENYIFPDASSTCELICELLDTEKITKEIAECLYTGMVTDTGVFQYSCTSSSTMNMAGMLMDKGIDFTKIVDEAFNQKTYNQNRAMGQALLSSRLRLGGRVVTSFLTLEEMHALEVLPKHMEGIVEQMRNTKDVELAVFLYENEDHTFKVSFRVNGAFDAASLAMHFGGGGHVKAAGCTVEGPAEEAIEHILAEVEKRL